MDVKQLIHTAKNLNSKERAFLAHCLISSLEEKHESHVDDAWAELSTKRFEQITSGAVSAVSWDELKKNITS